MADGRAKHWVFALVLLGLSLFIVALFVVPFVPLAVVGWGLCMIGLVLLIPIIRQELPRPEDGRQGPSRFDRLGRRLAGVFSLAGTLMLIGPTFLDIPSTVRSVGGVLFILSFLMFMVLNWRRLTRP